MRSFSAETLVDELSTVLFTVPLFLTYIHIYVETSRGVAHLITCHVESEVQTLLGTERALWDTGLGARVRQDRRSKACQRDSLLRPFSSSCVPGVLCIGR